MERAFLGVALTVGMYALAYANIPTFSDSENVSPVTIPSPLDTAKLDAMVLQIQQEWLKTSDSLLAKKGLDVKVRRAILDPSIIRKGA